MPHLQERIEISRDDIGDYMKAYAEENKIMEQPRRSLIGSNVWKEDPFGHTTSEVVPRTRFGSNSHLSGDRVHT